MTEEAPKLPTFTAPGVVGNKLLKLTYPFANLQKAVADHDPELLLTLGMACGTLFRVDESLRAVLDFLRALSDSEQGERYRMSVSALIAHIKRHLGDSE